MHRETGTGGLATIGALAAAATWAQELAVLAAVAAVAIPAACWAAIAAGKRHMVLAWPQRQPAAALSPPVRVVATPIRSHRPVAGDKRTAAVAVRIKGEIESGSEQ